MLRRLLILVFVSVFFILIYTSSCVHKPQTLTVTPDGNYPPAVANIIMNKCAISGCHNEASYQNADGFLLDTWDHLFNGSNHGATVVAYCPQYSPLLYFTNTDSADGEIVLKPSMPYSTPGRPQAALTKAEYRVLYNWIAAGAPDKNGNIPFASNPDMRQKIYLTQSGNDIMAVIDGQRKVVMRYFKIGMDSTQLEYAHDVQFSCDGKHAYVTFYSGNYIQKIDASKDTVMASVNVNSTIYPQTGSWSVLALSPTVDTELAATNFSASIPGFIKVNTVNMATAKYITGSSFNADYPHGIESNPGFDTFFITNQLGNTVWKCAPNAKPHRYDKLISLDNNSPTFSSDTLDPHQIQMVPDYSKYFVSCQGSNEVRVMDAHTDTLIAVIPVGGFPQEMAISVSKNYLFVACMQDNQNPMPGRLGSVYVIDYNTYKIVNKLYGDFYQPHDVCVDEQDALVYIVSTNANGLPVHHPVPGGGRPGWYSVYDLNTLQPADNKEYEVLIFPYAITCRF